ncbi:MAG: hypothetical protein GX346_02920 [Clostridiales bacterium]|nr:hypothetical protein [Clostridiales bacterium]
MKFLSSFLHIANKSTNYEFKFDPATLGQSLEIMLQGMLGIFIAIGMIMLVIYIFGLFTKNKKK